MVITARTEKAVLHAFVCTIVCFYVCLFSIINPMFKYKNLGRFLFPIVQDHVLPNIIGVCECFKLRSTKVLYIVLNTYEGN